MILYCVSHRLNGKKYIGVSKRQHGKRWTEHRREPFNPKSRSYHTPFYRAIRKYGLDSFVFEVVRDDITDITSLYKLETEYIVNLNTLSPNGYNLELRQDGERIITPALRRKLSASSHAIKRGKSSSYRGVFVSARGIYCHIYKGKEYTKGGFASQKEAATIRDMCALHLFGLDAQLNFPDKLDEYLAQDLELTFHQTFDSTKTSQYKGVSWEKRSHKWTAKLALNGKVKSLGNFKSEIEAAKAYDAGVLRFNKTRNYKQRFNFLDSV